MFDLDWSLSVGVRDYPDQDFQDLKGSELDATEFHQWVTSLAGGGISDPKRARLVVTSQFRPPFDSVLKAKPTAEQVKDFFKELGFIARQNEDARLGSKIGRRLYLFFSGHGYMPAAEIHSETALFMADVTRNSLGNHVLSRAWANVFASSGYFREVLLFVDCCRNEVSNTWLAMPFLTPGTDPEAEKTVRRFYAYATKAKGLARERQIAKDVCRGVFSATLMAGLSGAAANPDTNEIRGSDLKAFLYQNMPQFLAPEDRDNTELGAPDVWPELRPSEDFVICKAEPKKYWVRLKFSAQYQGRRINIRCNNQVKAKTEAKGTSWEVPLSCGVYSAEIVDGPEVPFERKHPGFGSATDVQEVDLG